MAFTPEMEYVPGFSLHFPKEISYDYLKFEGNGKAKFIWKMQKKSGIMKSGLDAMPLFLLDDLLKRKAFMTYKNINTAAYALSWSTP